MEMTKFTAEINGFVFVANKKKLKHKRQALRSKYSKISASIGMK